MTPAGNQTPLTRALDTVRRLRAELQAASGTQPLAIVGVGVRLPGGIVDLDGYWQALAEGRDLVRTIPAGRMGPFQAEWSDLPRRGGWLDEVMDFEPELFGISAREATAMDPQQRVLLETSWEALEDAALPPERTAGERVGFFVGITNQDYDDWRSDEPDATWGIGNARCYAAGRVAFTLGLTGPALAVDTSCSSSLVAVHLARQALVRRECDIALAAGVNLIVSPRSTRLISQSGLLAPDGLCKAFDARANGFTRSEGCGVVVLKRLADAERDGDRIHAVLAGSAVNQDGRSASITAPNVRSQIDLIGAALADAGLEPADVGVVEAHGTGTALGDPLEMDGLATALGRVNGGARLYVGSVKANMGHLESAAGMAGLLKAVLCLRHRAVPPVTHLRTLNPRIDVSGTAIVVPDELTPWPEAAGRHIGVSSFGMSGTNAHVILGAADPSAAEAEAAEVTGFEISARSQTALRSLAGLYRDRLEKLSEDEYAAFAYTATFGRARHGWRARVAAADLPAAAKALAALADGADSAAVTVHQEAGAPAVEGLARAVIELPAYPWERRRFAAEPLLTGSRFR